MRKLLTGSAAALALAGVTLGAASPAEARWHGSYGGYGGYHGRGYYGYHHGDRTAAVLGAGILGLAAGAAIASSNAPRYYYYDDYGPDYYAPPPRRYYYAPAPYCRTDWRWDGWARRYVRVSYCD